MPLSDEQINAIAGPADYWDRRVFARAIESASTAPLLAQIAQLEAQLAEARNNTLADVAMMLERQHDWLTRVSAVNLVRGIYGNADKVQKAIDAAIAQEQPEIQPAQQEQPHHLWDGSPWPNYRVTREDNTPR